MEFLFYKKICALEPSIIIMKNSEQSVSSVLKCDGKTVSREQCLEVWWKNSEQSVSGVLKHDGKTVSRALAVWAER